MVGIIGDISGSLLSAANRANFSDNEKTVVALFEEGFSAPATPFFDEWVREDYIQHAIGIAQGRDGIRRMAQGRYWRPGIKAEFIPIHLISEGDTVAIHRVIRFRDEDGALIEVGAGVDIFKCDKEHRLAEHWHVLEPQPLDFDPAVLSDGA